MPVHGGGYICFSDSDDYLTDDPSFLRKAVSIAEKKQVDIVAWLWQYQDTNGNLVVRKENTPGDFSGVKSGREFARYLYQGSYANGLVVSVWNKLYRRSVIHEIAFDGRLCEDDAWNDQVINRANKILCLDTFGYVYAQNTDSLTNQKFSEERLAFLDTLKTRAEIFAEDDFIQTETKKLFLTIYIEYYFKALAAGISPYADMKTFHIYKRDLQRCGQLNLKTRIRYGIFAASPALYKRIVLRRS